eukprot:403340364
MESAMMEYQKNNGLDKLQKHTNVFKPIIDNFENKFYPRFLNGDYPELSQIQKVLPSLSEQTLNEIYQQRLEFGSHAQNGQRLNICLIFDILTHGKLFTEQGIDHLYLMEEFDLFKHDQKFFVYHYLRFYYHQLEAQDGREFKRQLSKLSLNHKVKFFYITHKYLNWQTRVLLGPRKYIEKLIIQTFEKRSNLFSKQQVLDIFEGLSVAEKGNKRILNKLLQRIYEQIDKDCNNIEQIDWLTLKVILTLSPRTKIQVNEETCTKIIELIAKKIWTNLKECKFGQYSKCFFNMESMQILFLLSLNREYMSKIADDKIKEFFLFESIIECFDADYLFSEISQNELFEILKALQSVENEKEQRYPEVRQLEQKRFDVGLQYIIDKAQDFQPERHQI